MQRFANWTNLSETTFVLPPTTRRRLPCADLHPRPRAALRRASHAWHLSRVAVRPRAPTRDAIVQQCAAGLISVRRTDAGLAFAARRSSGLARRRRRSWTRSSRLGVDRDAIVDAEWVDNGPGWIALLLDDADAVLALRPGARPSRLGVVGPLLARRAAAIEVRAFLPLRGRPRGPGDRQPQRVAGPVAAGDGRARALRRPPGHRDRRAAASTSARTPAEPSGSAAPRTP